MLYRRSGGGASRGSFLDWKMLLLSFCSRKPRLSAAEQQRLVELLKHGPERLGYETPLWTCWRVAHLIEQEFGVRYHAGHVWKLLRAMNWSVQRPTGRALERDEEAIRRWKQHRWPALKKSAKSRPATAARHSAEIRKLQRTGVSKSEIARRLKVGRTSVRRILGTPP
jgi:transposase